MIEVRVISSSTYNGYELIIDGIAARAGVSLMGIGVITASLTDSVVIQKVLDHRFSDVGGYFLYSLEFVPENLIVERDEIDEKISITKTQSQKGWHLSFDYYLTSSKWKQLWSITEYTQEFSRVVMQNSNPDIQCAFRNKPANEFSIIFKIPEQGNLIRDEVLKCSKVLRELHSVAMKSLTARLHGDAVITYFDFPEEVRVPCEQYLLYFVQFLKDLEVEATVELQHEAGQVLFAVMPNDKEQALDKIRVALEAYLHLPSSPVSDAPQGEIAVLRLNSEF